MSDDSDRDVIRLATEVRGVLVQSFGADPLRGLRGVPRSERVREILRYLGAVPAFAELRALLEPQFIRESMGQCARLFNLGRCQTGCPDVCTGPFHIAYGLRSERELVEALVALDGQNNGGLNITLHDAEVRRVWNVERGLVQRVQINTLYRNGAPTPYGRHLLEALESNPLAGRDLRWVHSWLSDLYDDACDIGSPIAVVEPNSPEGRAGARYGHMPARVLRRRLGDDQRRAADEALPAQWSLSGFRLDDAERSDRFADALRRVDAICVTLFDSLELADNAILAAEEPIWAPIVDGETPESVLAELERGLDERGREHRRFVQDDGDEVIEVLVQPKDHPLTTLPGRLRGVVLLDDYFAAWAFTRSISESKLRVDVGESAVQGNGQMHDDESDDVQ